MKKRFALVFFLLIGSMAVQAQEMTTENFNEWRIVTVVESIVPMGLGRSRMIENMTDVNTEDFRTSRVNGKQSSQRTISRKELKVDKFDEAKKMLQSEILPIKTWHSIKTDMYHGVFGIQNKTPRIALSVTPLL